MLQPQREANSLMVIISATSFHRDYIIIVWCKVKAYFMKFSIYLQLVFGPSGETRLHFLPGGKKIEVLPPSSRRQATVHRTVAFNCSSLAPYKQKVQTPQKRILDFWSEWRDSNSRHPGPKPGALPTGPHPDIELKKNARCGQICGQGNSTTVLPNFQRK